MKICLFCILIFLRLPAIAQNSTYIINASGQNFTNDGISIDWCIGDALLAPGLIKSVEFPAGTIKAFPTITKHFITLLFNTAEKGEVNMIIVDVLGRPVTKKSFSVNDFNVQRTISVDNLSKGIYFLQVQFSPGAGPENHFTFKFIKS